VTALLLNLRVSGAEAWQFALVVMPASLGGVALGLCSIGVAIAYRDAFAVPNIFQAVILVTSGAVFPASHPAKWLVAIGRCLPLGNAVSALNQSIATGHTELASLRAELAVDFGYGAVGYVFIKLMLRLARQRGSFDLS